MIVACFEAQPADEAVGDETAETDTGDEVGESSSTTTDGDTTTTTTTTDDGETTDTSTDDDCPIGSEGCACTLGGSCDMGLVCSEGICTPDPDADTTDTTTDTGDTACAMDMAFEILAVDASAFDGWNPTMSMLGEGMVMAWDQQTMNAFITWDIDVPCDDTWHVWVRGIDQNTTDSFFASVDGQPNPGTIFELDCTPNPNQGTYVWRELNWREMAAPACTYLLDPWTQDWMLGIHQLTLTYRESNSVSKLWITNTVQLPP
jgi:hypothetical protein